MLSDRIEERWIAAFAHTFRLCALSPGESVAILSESQSRALNVHLAELAVQRLGGSLCHVVVPTPEQRAPVPVRSTGASVALQQNPVALAALHQASLIIDCTVEGLLHAVELPGILQAGARVMMISNEHPDALERLLPQPSMKARVRHATALLKAASRMQVSSEAGTELEVDLSDTPGVGVWGYTDRPGTIAHWPGGVALSFPKRNTVNGRLVLDAGDINLTFKRYLDAPVALTIDNDYVVAIDGQGTDAELMRRYLAAWDDPEAYAVSHVGFGLNPAARYEALCMYDQRDTNGTELRAFAGNFLFSTGANEFAGRFTEGHFDIPVRGCTIRLDGEAVITQGQLEPALAGPESP